MRKKEPLLPVLILGLLAFTVLWPLWFTVDGALMALDELTAALGPALLDTADGGYAVWTILPSWPTLQPLAELLLDTPQFFSAFWNTCLLAFAQIAGQLVVAAPASWAFAKLRFAGRRFLLLGYIALMVLPFQVLMVPNYLIATRLGIYDTPLSVILPGVFSAFPVFIMTRSFQDVPNELLEAAKLDGATAWQTFWKIGVPLGFPARSAMWQTSSSGPKPKACWKSGWSYRCRIFRRCVRWQKPAASCRQRTAVCGCSCSKAR